MTHLLEVRFKGNRREYFTWPSPESPSLRVDDAVIVEVERGAPDDVTWQILIARLEQPRIGLDQTTPYDGLERVPALAGGALLTAKSPPTSG